MSNNLQFEKLFQPCNIGNLQLKNRVVMPSMGNNFGSEDGCVTERLVAYYNERAKGGSGLIITEMVCMDSPLGRRGANQLRIDEDCYIDGLSNLTRQIHNSRCKIAIQLCHAGLFAASKYVQIQPVAPSPTEYFGQKVTEELSISQIENIINHFVEGARAGYKRLTSMVLRYMLPIATYWPIFFLLYLINDTIYLGEVLKIVPGF